MLDVVDVLFDDDHALNGLAINDRGVYDCGLRLVGLHDSGLFFLPSRLSVTID